MALGFLLAGSVSFGQSVTIPLDRYDQLRAKAFPRPAEAGGVEVGLSFESMEMDLSVDLGHARLKAVATLWVYGEGWHSVPWPVGLPLLGLRAPSGEARIEVTDKEQRLAFRGSPGRHRVEFEATLPVTVDTTATRPISTFWFPLPWAARVVGTLTGDETVGDVTAGGALRLEPSGAHRWRFTGWPGSTANLTLAGRPAAAVVERPLRFEVITATALTLQRTRRQADVWLSAAVEGRLERMSLPVPEGFEVVSVEGLAGLGWDVRNGQLELTFPAAAPANWTLHAALSGDAADASAVPLLLPAGARRTLVVTKAVARGGGILERADGGAGRTAEDNELKRLPTDFVNRVGEPLVVTAGAAAPRWRVSWPQDTKVLGAQVDRLLVDVLIGEHGRAYYQIWAVVRSNGAPDLALQLPGNARLIESQRDGIGARLGQRGAAWVTPLVSRDAPQILFWTAEIDLPWPRDGEGRLEIPIPGSSSPISTVEVRAGLPGAFRYEWADPSRRGGIAGPPSPVGTRAAANELGRQFRANTLSKAAPTTSATGFQAFPAGFQELAATWSALDTTPSPLVLTVHPATEVRR